MIVIFSNFQTNLFSDLPFLYSEALRVSDKSQLRYPAEEPTRSKISARLRSAAVTLSRDLCVVDSKKKEV